MVSATATSTKNTIRRFNPTEIFPKDGLRINSTTLRDWQQSVASGREATAHMERTAQYLKLYNESLADNYPGAAEAGGGTVPRMDVTVRNEDMYEHVAKLKAQLPNSPLMALIRSDAGGGMEEVAKDVLESYLINYHKAGIDVFRNFHALNDPNAFVRVAKALYKTKEANGTQAHFQAAYSYATNPDEPIVYNARTPVTFFKRLVARLREEAIHDGLDEKAYLPHSFVIKDPSGVLDNEMAGGITRIVKKAMRDGELPELPFGIHTHNQMGRAERAYEAAAIEGANFIDCAPSEGGYGAQPSMTKLAQQLGGEDGAAIGFKNKADYDAAVDALKNVDKLSGAILQSHDPDVRQNAPDPTVEDHCIAGGQASLARAEVKANLLKGKPEGTVITREQIDAFMTKAKAIMPKVRKELGVPCLVTPVADYIFREAARRINAIENIDKAIAQETNPEKTAELRKARENVDKKDFYCGYRRIMTGEMGPTMEPVDAERQKQAMLERIEIRLGRAVEDKSKHKGIKQSGALIELRDMMMEISKPVREQERFEKVSDRIEEIKYLKEHEGLLFMDHKLQALENEHSTLKAGEAERKEKIGLYNEFLKTRSDELVKKIDDWMDEKKKDPSAKPGPLVQYYLDAVAKMPSLKQLQVYMGENQDTKEAIAPLGKMETIRLIKSASYTSVPIAELLPDGLPIATNRLKELAKKGEYKLPDNEQRLQEDATTGRMLRDPHAANPDGLVHAYFQRRDGLAPTQKKETPTYVGIATFDSSITADALEAELIKTLLSEGKNIGHTVSALNVQVTQMNDDQDMPRHQIKISGIQNPMAFGHGIIQKKIKELGGELTAFSHLLKMQHGVKDGAGGAVGGSVG